MVADMPDDAQSSQKRAVALRYDEEQDAAPVVVATGRGRMAEAIIEAAREHGITIQEDAQLVDALSQLDLGETIPAELYPVVAEVLVFVARANRERAKARRQGP